MNNTGDQYCEILSLYNKAEGVIKDLSFESDGADTSAINELRYAGQHILRAITALDEETEKEEVRRAKSHCERAVYDAYDGAIFFLMTRYQSFKEDYAFIPVSGVVENFVEIEKTMRGLKRFLAISRDESNGDRAIYYKKIEEKYPEIVEAVETLESARGELNKVLIDTEEERRKSRLFWSQPWVTPIFSLIAASIGATAILIANWLLK